MGVSPSEEPEAEKEPENLLNVLAEGVKDMKQQGEARFKRSFHVITSEGKL